MSDNNIINESIAYVEQVLKDNFKPENIYHNLNHTKDVANVCSSLGEKSDFSSEEMEILTIAAWFHDIGYIEAVDEHGQISAKIATEFLTGKNYLEDKIKQVVEAIYATKIPQSAKSKIGEVLCDSDLHHLGTKGFFDKNKLFRVELERRWSKNFSDSEWLKHTLDFFYTAIFLY